MNILVILLSVLLLWNSLGVVFVFWWLVKYGTSSLPVILTGESFIAVLLILVSSVTLLVGLKRFTAKQ